MIKKGKGSFSEKFNETIISMIHKKLSPLHRKKKQADMAMCRKPASTIHAKNNDSSLPSLPSPHIYNLSSLQEPNEHRLLDRVKDYLQAKRRENHVSDKKGELQQYISIFEMPLVCKDRNRRQSIELTMYQFQKKEVISDQKKLIGFVEEQVGLNDDARSMLNAKIRRKLNHRKIIDLVRRN